MPSHGIGSSGEAGGDDEAYDSGDDEAYDSGDDEACCIEEFL